MWPILFFFCPNHIFGTGEAKHFKFGVYIEFLILRSTSACNRLLPMGCACSHVSFKNWEITDNGRLIWNRMWPTEWHQFDTNDLERPWRSFLLFDIFLYDYHTSGNVTCAIDDMFIHVLQVVSNVTFHTAHFNWHSASQSHIVNMTHCM